MALFSRRKKTERDDSPVQATAEPTVAPPVATEPEPAASVGISMSSFRGLGAHDAPAPEPVVGTEPSTNAAGEAAASTPPVRTTPGVEHPPASTEIIPGLRDNVVLREALSKMSDPSTPAELLEVARQLLQGHLFLRVKGDARSLLSEGKDLPVGVATLNGKQFVLAYSNGSALRESVAADREADTSAMGQPVPAVLRYVLGGDYAGLIIDHSSFPARAVLPRELLQKLHDQAEPSLEIKTLLSGDRSDATAPAIADALTRVTFWVAVNKSEEGRFGVAEARSPEGERYLELYTHPLEVASQGRGDQPAPMTAAQLGAAVRADEQLTGVIVDPGGPWIRLSRADLAPVIALAQ